ncbi:hypothetical protein ACFQ1S_11950 [Kibdelosporangium lantanae]|uniref:FXSXX-COOH protein n=1 Tax=Kibdelosporangium lantanae TaxID=1497396 RepID=A0ABW3M8K2_9PSEU
MQIYDVDPATIGEATKIIVGENRATHTDTNFGCPRSTPTNSLR